MIKIIIFLSYIFIFFNNNLLAEEKNNELKIGLLAPFTGEYKYLGESLLLSVQLALDEIGDKNIKIIPRDSGSNDKDKINISIKEIIGTGAKVIIGPTDSENFKELVKYKDTVFISLSNKNPKIEENIGNPLSPYAVTKYVNELYAGVYARTYGFKTIGLRYFNVFGKRQDPDSAYAAVIPRWTSAIIKDEEVFINGDGETSRDFCFIENTVQMNILAATASDAAKDQIYNVALGDRTSLNDLFSAIKDALNKNQINIKLEPIYRDFRPGDVRHSRADISKAKKALGYQPRFNILKGLDKAMPWYVLKLGRK